MSIFNNYPYTDFHELNLDWILQQIKETIQKTDEFIHLNTIKYADPIEWDIERQYEANTVVIDDRTGEAYISTKAVPDGVHISDTNYWTSIFNYRDAIDLLEEQLFPLNMKKYQAAPQNLSIGNYIWWYSELYVVKANMIAGDHFVEGSNIEKITLQQLLSSITTTIDESGLKRLAATGHFETDNIGWIAYKNTKYTGDNGSRFYLIPKAKVTEGTGACLKIFADNYPSQGDYRDLGIYFSADQNGDSGYYGSGVDWINVKVYDNGEWAGKHPDLGFSFQDGHVVAGRFTCFNNSRAELCLGNNVPKLGPAEVLLEVQGHMGMAPDGKIKFCIDEHGQRADAVWYDTTDEKLKWSTANGSSFYIGGVKKAEISSDALTLGTNSKLNFEGNGGIFIKDSKINLSTPAGASVYASGNNILDIGSDGVVSSKAITSPAVVTTGRVNVSSSTSSINVTGSNRVVIGEISSSINSITGVDGQEITIFSVGSSSPTIVNGSSIKLQNGDNCVLGYGDTLTLCNINGTWYEKCRSINH